MKNNKLPEKMSHLLPLMQPAARRENPPGAFDDPRPGYSHRAGRRRDSGDPIPDNEHVSGPRGRSGPIDERDVAKQKGRSDRTFRAGRQA